MKGQCPRDRTLARCVPELTSKLPELTAGCRVPKMDVAILASHGQEAAIRRKTDDIRLVVAPQGVPHFSRRRVPDEGPLVLKTHRGQRLAVRRESDAPALDLATRSPLGPFVDLVLVAVELSEHLSSSRIHQQEFAAATHAGQQPSIR